LTCFNIKASALKKGPSGNNSAPIDFLKIWPEGKVIHFNSLQSSPEKLRKRLDQLSADEKEKTRMMTAHVLNLWEKLSASFRKITLYGAGQHSKWLIELIGENNLPLPKAIIDDKPHQNNICSIPVFKSSDFDFATTQILFVSSDFHAKKMTCNAAKLPLGQCRIINPYEDFDQPYFQK